MMSVRSIAVLAICELIVLGGCASDESNTASRQSERSVDQRSVQPTPPWTTLVRKDEFGDIAGRVAVSRWVSPVQNLSFPYDDLQAQIHVACTEIYFRFTETPNLTDAYVGQFTPAGSSSSDLAWRVNGKNGERDGSWPVKQVFGDNDLRVRGAFDVAQREAERIAVISGGTRFAISLAWYGLGNVAFSWDLTGSAEAIRESCN